MLKASVKKGNSQRDLQKCDRIKFKDTNCINFKQLTTIKKNRQKNKNKYKSTSQLMHNNKCSHALSQSLSLSVWISNSKLMFE